ncbi:hypothetical protein CY34DRAFT_252984 [Suillus luteus UH-Slu-Lm8-n1]|uniref:Uncharacterized protein n=1 Tax=Suillus luteus UH-Slu-Lm8-n1 TaxID=930992 RepID=A0A0D0BAX4_9AGAM|nr:hypothetical protein CY34DRAFT_252984 [Suillus luteus UH-Slu-Lm8-n1]
MSSPVRNQHPNYSLFDIFSMGPLLLVNHKYSLMSRRWPLVLLSIVSNAIDHSKEEQPEYVGKSSSPELEYFTNVYLWFISRAMRVQQGNCPMRSLNGN